MGRSELRLAVLRGPVGRYDIGLNICNGLYAEAAPLRRPTAGLTALKVDPAETCRTDRVVRERSEFYERVLPIGSFPSSYDGALFFGDFRGAASG